MRVLVTGGAGFIGSHLASACLAAGDEVTVLDDLSTGEREAVPPAARLVEADAADPEAVAGAVTGAELVYHLAALGAVPRSIADPVATDRANTLGTLRVLVASREAAVRRVVVTSSSSVFGGEAPLPTPPDAPLVPKSPYAVSKAAAEGYARVFAGLYAMETVIVRPFNVFGPRQRSDSRYAAVVPRFVRAALSGSAPEVHGDGTQTRDFTFIDDAVAAFRLAGEVPGISGRSYNVGAGRQITILDLLEALSGLITPFPEPRFVAERAGDVRHSRADITAATRDLGYAPAVTFADGLRLTVAWAKEVEAPVDTRGHRR